MSHGQSATDKIVAARRHERFMRTWIRNPTFYPAFAIIVTGVIAVTSIAVHHFTNNNAVIVDKRRPIQFFDEECTRIMSHTRQHRGSVNNGWIDRETGKALIPFADEE